MTTEMTTADHDHSDLSWLGTTLTVWAHPDDETYLGGGLSSILSDQGVRVVCVTATRGEAGAPLSDVQTRMTLAKVRAQESTDAMEILGVREHVWLDYPDGACATVDPANAIASLVDILQRVRPQTIVTFGPEGHTGHPDHRAVSRWVDEAVLRSSLAPRILHVVVTEAQLAVDPELNDDFGVFDEGRPRVCKPEDLALQIELSEAVLQRKVDALVRHRSQTEGLIDAVGLDRLAAWVAVESFAAPASQGSSR
ncbi:MAG: PIG-L family deacetylase [Actinomycetota bacterium]|nr:PIG-L family deacetylase [Actinomycetota bacterium]